MNPRSPFGYVDFIKGVLPITKVIPMLAELIKRARKENEHIVITQNGYPAAVLLSIEAYTKMHELAMKQLEQPGEEEGVN